MCNSCIYTINCNPPVTKTTSVIYSTSPVTSSRCLFISYDFSQRQNDLIWFNFVVVRFCDFSDWLISWLWAQINRFFHRFIKKLKFIANFTGRFFCDVGHFNRFTARMQHMQHNAYRVYRFIPYSPSMRYTYSAFNEE